MANFSTELFSEVYAGVNEALAILMCAEDSTQEEHIKTTLSIANGTLINVSEELKNWRDAAIANEKKSR